MNAFSSDKFAWLPTTTTLAADASDLQVRPGEVPGDRMYKDSCDHGIAIRSVITGKVALYTLKEHSGEVTQWEYEPVKYHPEMFIDQSEVASFGAYKNTKVVIFND